MSFRIAICMCVLFFGQLTLFGQKGQKAQKSVFIDTLIIKDNITGEASERLSQMRKPIKRNFYLKANKISYHLFQGNVAALSPDEIMEVMGSGFSLFIDRMEHKMHANLKPSSMDILDKQNTVIETIDNINKMEESVLLRKMGEGSSVRFSGFPISVNEHKYGPIQMEVKIKEEE
ncbi:MAG: hypothetical protein P1U56_12760 [Saprospiraceae bacterium]|nr:hypothetical protein [Saprospiraceae bacterium]